MTPPLALDHLVIAVRDLELATANYQRLLGRATSWRGNHPTFGTANALFRIDNTYVELLAPAEGGVDSPWQRALRAHLEARGEGMYAIALGTTDIDASVAAARERGLDVQDPVAGDGVDLTTNARREWRNARIEPASTRGVTAFFIDHRSPADALPVAKPDASDGSCVLAVDHTVVASSDPDATIAVWRDALGLDLRLTLDNPAGRRLQFLRLGDSILEIVGDPSNQQRSTSNEVLATSDQQPGTSNQRPATSDQLWGVAYRVGDVERAVARLRAAGVGVSDVRSGNAPGTRVADMKPGFSHDVRTLLIDKQLARTEVPA